MQVDGPRKQAGSLRDTRADRSFRERVPGKGAFATDEPIKG